MAGYKHPVITQYAVCGDVTLSIVWAIHSIVPLVPSV